MTTALVHLPGWPPGIKSKQAIAQYLRIESSWGSLPPEEDNRSLPIERRSINNLYSERVYRYFEKCGQSFDSGRSSPHSAGPWRHDVAFQPCGRNGANRRSTDGVRFRFVFPGRISWMYGSLVPTQLEKGTNLKIIIRNDASRNFYLAIFVMSYAFNSSGIVFTSRLR